MSMALVVSVPVRRGLAPKASAAWPVPVMLSNFTVAFLSRTSVALPEVWPVSEKAL